MSAKAQKFPPLNPLAMPMALMGLRTRDVESFCAGVALVAETIAAGCEYGARHNALQNSETLSLFAAALHSEAMLPTSPFNPVGHANVIHRAVVVAALRSLMAEAFNQRSMSEAYREARRQDYDYFTRTVAAFIDQIHS